MKRAATIVAAVGLLGMGLAQADAGEELLKKSGCTACHAIDKKLVGPAYVEVAAKYKGDAGAPAKLMEKIKKGGSGVWGQVPMPPNPQVSDADIKAVKDAGYDDAQVIEIVLHVALNTLTNHVNETVKTEIDFPAVTTNPLRKAA